MNIQDLKFRAKYTEYVGVHVGDWEFSNKFSKNPHEAIAEFFRAIANGLVDPATLGMWTGLKDKNGKEIYEGDILEVSGMSFPVVVDDYHGFRFVWGKDNLCKHYGENGEIIGNIHDKEETKC